MRWQEDIPGFKKVLGRWDSVAIITSIVIGIGIFRAPAEVAGYLKHPWLILSAWFLGGVICLLGVFCYAELASTFPKTGGNYIYLRESYGRGAGFLFAWTELLVIRTGSIAAVSFIGSEYLQSLSAIDKSFIKLMAVSIVLILSLLNIFGLSYGKKVHNFFTAINITALVSIVFFGLLSRKGDMAHFFSGTVSLDNALLRALGAALIPILWTYGGWHENTFVAEETKDASRVIPQALIIGISIVTALYLAVNFFYIYLIPVKDLAGSALVGSNVFNALYGAPGRKIFELLVVVASLGSINAMIITGARITYAMAKDNAIFAYIGKVNARYGTPQRAIAINALWCSILILLGTFNKLLFFTGILVWLFFASAAGGIFILRKKFLGLERPYKVWGYPATPIIFILICITLFINTLIFNPVPSLFGLGLLASGVPVYVVSRLREARRA